VLTVGLGQHRGQNHREKRDLHDERAWVEGTLQRLKRTGCEVLLKMETQGVKAAVN
jgi:hypothetical protein